MALTPGQVRELERLGVDNVRERLRYAGPGGGSIVPGLGDGKMLRSDVEGWLEGQDKAARKTRRKIARRYALVGKGSCMALRSRDHCGSNRLFPCTLRWRRDGSASLRADGGNEKRTPPPKRIAGAGFGRPPLFKALPWLEVFPCGGRQ
jgi:hypothetical protein